MPRTYTHFFTDDSPGMPQLRAAFREIELDFLDRKEHLPQEVQVAMEKRVDALRLAWYFMLEPVPFES